MEFELWELARYRSATVDELEQRREAIAAELENAESEIDTAELRSQVEMLREEMDKRNTAAELRSANIAAVTSGAGIVRATTPAPVAETRSTEDYTDSVEYRTAFMEYVCRGTALPENVRAQLRANEVTTAAENEVVIPKTLMNEIIKKMDTYGNIWAKVRKLSVKGGIEFAISDLHPTATWIGETEVSEYQKLTIDQTISFNYYGLECRIAQTLLASVVTLEAFQRMFVPLATEAIVRALEKGVFTGTGTGQMTGILVDPRIPTENVITMTEAELGSWEAWHKKVKAKMKKAYRKGEFVMAQGSFDGYIDGMTDNNGQPVGRVNYGINGEEIQRFAGKNVETVEEDILPDFSTASAGDVVAVFIDFSNYAVNTNMQLSVVQWEDYETNQKKTRALIIADGKILDPYGVLIIKKGGSTKAADKA